ncbi:hypothetical protein CYD30_14680 [Kosakonia cowanii]|jgi:hypothetical protein|uniref:Uncharacterized protein n=1 Tax=Mixta tenebrionis TaxID=2562439 RepID=A0A506V0L8_9GAMM|nr:hypothetical protein [Mixta tenebrionis]TNL09053.1 hypothetical protein CYD30_14680 [Kosakonia cowanii]TPW39294.1 hypothetical protein FKM52_19450 [Mixta tenebrionis]
MNSAVKWLLTRLLPGVVLCAALAGAGWWLHSTGYDSGHKDAKADGDTALASEKQARADERQQLAQAGQQALLQARDNERQQRERADQLALQLANKEFELTQTNRLLQLGINKAVSDDNQTSGCGYNGLGPHGLQLYTKALGYAAGGNTRADDSSGQ